MASQTKKNYSWAIWVGVIAIVCYAAFINDDKQPTKNTSSYTSATQAKNIDPRVSPNGKVRPTISSTTVWATIDYYNPNSGTTSTYRCEVDLDNSGRVLRINWRNGGWLEADDLTENADGTQTITRSDGAEYTVHLDNKDEDEDTETEEN